MGDFHRRFKEVLYAARLSMEINKQDERIQYTIDMEGEDKSLASLNIKATNNIEGSYDLPICRKNVQTKPESGHDPKKLIGIFKRFVHTAYKDELGFQENGYKEQILRRFRKR